MPNVRIKVKRSWVGAQRAAVVDVVHRTMVETIRIPENDRALRLIEHDSDAYSTPPERGDKFTPVEITLSARRSMDARRKLCRATVWNL